MEIVVNSDHFKLKLCNAFDLYKSIRSKVGDDDAFLLESSNHTNNCTNLSAVIGFGYLLKVKIKNSKLEFFGNSIITKHIISKAITKKLLIYENEYLRLTERYHIWDVLRLIKSLFSVNVSNTSSDFNFGFFGYIGYDTAKYIENLPCLLEDKYDQDDIFLVIPQVIIKYYQNELDPTVIINNSKYWKSLDINTITESFQLTTEQNPAKTTLFSMPDVTITVESDKHKKNIEKALHYISIGDIYQAVLGYEIKIKHSKHAFDVYSNLRADKPAPYMYYTKLGETTIFGVSPELYLRVIDSEIITEPIAGTARKSTNSVENEKIKNKLGNDKKENAEHVMLIDLFRNDLGKICSPNTLKVENFLSVQEYAHAFHLVSTVSGKLKYGLDCFDAIAAIFPAGVVTGAPKIRAMEIIEELEATKRGIYAGAIGLIDFGNTYVNLGLCIVTIVHSNDTFSLRASSGIVSDSIPEDEWNEILTKLAPTFKAVTDREIYNESFAN